MSEIKTQDDASTFYKDWGAGQPLVFSHGSPLNADAWDEQLMFFAAQGYRVIAYVRRGHGRSSQTWNGNDMDTYADDLGALMEALDLRDVVMVGHSTGGGEVTRTIGRHGTSRVAKVVLVGIKGAYDCIKAFSETDLTEDLKRFDVPTPFIHGEDDQIVPIDDAARIAVTLVPGAKLLAYSGAAHGLTATEKVRFNADVLAFVKA